MIRATVDADGNITHVREQKAGGPKAYNHDRHADERASEISLNEVKTILFPYLDDQITTEAAQRLISQLKPYLRTSEPVNVTDGDVDVCIRNLAYEFMERFRTEGVRLNPELGDDRQLGFLTRLAATAIEMFPRLKQAPMRESVAPWTFVGVDEKHRLCNLPKHEQKVLFQYGEWIHAGVFLDDVRESSYPDGEKYEGDFGFYSNNDTFYEAERVRCWMPQPELPKSDESEGGES